MWVSGRDIAVLAGRVYLRHDPPITPAGVCRQPRCLWPRSPRATPARARSNRVSAGSRSPRPRSCAGTEESTAGHRTRRRVRPTDPRCPATYSITLWCGWQCCTAGAQRRWTRLARSRRRAQRSRVGDPGPHYAVSLPSGHELVRCAVARPPQARYSTGRQSRPGHRSTGRHLRPPARPNPHARTAPTPGAQRRRTGRESSPPTRAARPPPVIRQDLSLGGAHGVRERLPSVDSGLLFWRRTG